MDDKFFRPSMLPPLMTEVYGPTYMKNLGQNQLATTGQKWSTIYENHSPNVYMPHVNPDLYREFSEPFYKHTTELFPWMDEYHRRVRSLSIAMDMIKRVEKRIIVEDMKQERFEEHLREIYNQWMELVTDRLYHVKMATLFRFNVRTDKERFIADTFFELMDNAFLHDKLTFRNLMNKALLNPYDLTIRFSNEETVETRTFDAQIETMKRHFQIRHQAQMQDVEQAGQRQPDKNTLLANHDTTAKLGIKGFQTPSDIVLKDSIDLAILKTQGALIPSKASKESLQSDRLHLLKLIQLTQAKSPFFNVYIREYERLQVLKKIAEKWPELIGKPEHADANLKAMLEKMLPGAKKMLGNQIVDPTLVDLLKKTSKASPAVQAEIAERVNLTQEDILRQQIEMKRQTVKARKKETV